MKTETINRSLVTQQIRDAVSRELGFDLNSIDALHSRAQALDSETFPRAELSRALVDYNLSIGNDDDARVNALRLAESETVAIVAGQQAGLFTGPAYSVYKALTAIKLARLMEERLGRTVVPIYWNATEDHDLSEIASCHFPEKIWTAPFSDNGRAAEGFSTESLVDVIPQFIESISEYLRLRVREVLGHRCDGYGEFSSSVIAKLFAGSGLVVLEPKLLRPMAVDFFQRALGQNDALRDELRAGGERLAGIGIDRSFPDGEGSGLFMIQSDGVRRRITVAHDGFEVNGETFSLEEMLSAVKTGTERFSTGAWLRPALQNHCIPTLAFVAGPGEVRYHLQLKGVFDALELEMAPIWLRNHMTIMGAKEDRIWTTLGWGNDDLYRDVEELRPVSDLSETVESVFTNGLAALDHMGGELKVGLADYSCDRSIEGFLTKTKKEFEKVRRRVVKEDHTRHGVDNKRIDRLLRVIRPNGGPQERRMNVFALMSAYGPSLMEDLMNLIDPLETGHYLIRPGFTEM